MKHSTWMNIAKVVAEESKCVSLNVGCVLVKDDHIISTGVNGTPKGYTNCCDKFTVRCDAHHAWSLKYEVHSEMNSLLHCPVATEGSIAYITHSCCFNCCKHLIAAGIKGIYYGEVYHRTTEKELKEVLDFCNENNVIFKQLR